MSNYCAVQAPATKLSMTEKERLLPKLVEEGWLANLPDRQGTYSIGVRIIFLPVAMTGTRMLAWPPVFDRRPGKALKLRRIRRSSTCHSVGAVSLCL